MAEPKTFEDLLDEMRHIRPKPKTLDDVREQHRKRMKGFPATKEQHTAVTYSLRHAQEAVRRAEAKLRQAKAEEERAVVWLLVTLGVAPYVIDGVALEPWSRSGRIFLRRRDAGEVIKTKRRRKATK